MSALNTKTALSYCRVWHHLDASGGIVGRLASKISTVLQGKHKPIHTNGSDCGDYVVVTNTDKMKFTGTKLKRKCHYTHTGWPGGLRKHMLGEEFKNDSTSVLFRAVSGMLPKNSLRKRRLHRLKIFKDSENLFQDNIGHSYE